MQRTSVLGRVDALFFAFSALSATWLAYLLLRDGIRPGWPWLLLIVFWAFFSYLLLPRLHRILTRLYIPGYFIGRARTSDGLLGDPVNLALLGARVTCITCWTPADGCAPTTVEVGDVRDFLSAEPIFGSLRRADTAHADLRRLLDVLGRRPAG